jgi:kynurenine formamidase
MYKQMKMTSKKVKFSAAIVTAAVIFFGNFVSFGQNQTRTTLKIVDLTHTLNESFPYIPIPGITFPFKKTPIATIEKNGVAANAWEIHEHIGTQIDAPSHFSANGISLEQIPVEKLIAPLAVIDIRERAKQNADATVTIEDIRNWEKQYGRLPNGAAVFMYSGWDAKVSDAKAFINADEKNTMHFPGFSSEAADFLFNQREIVGIGVDTISIDPGFDKEYKAHKIWLKADKWAVECAANLSQVPASGATIFVGATKVEGATGGLVRIIATFPSNRLEKEDASYKNISGNWISESVEPVGSFGFRTREFRFKNRDWQIEAVFYADKEKSKPLFSFVGEGKFQIGGKSNIVGAATEAEFSFSKKKLKLLTDDAEVIKNFGFGDCGLKKGEFKDISDAGCGNFTSVSVCGKEYDLVAIENGILRLGSRPADGNMCSAERRPKSLGSALIQVKK